MKKLKNVKYLEEERDRIESEIERELFKYINSKIKSANDNLFEENKFNLNLFNEYVFDREIFSKKLIKETEGKYNFERFAEIVIRVCDSYYMNGFKVDLYTTQYINENILNRHKFVHYEDRIHFSTYINIYFKW